MFNVRPLFIAAISLIVGIVIITNHTLNTSALSLVLLVLLLLSLALIIAFIIYLIAKHKTGSVWFVTLVLCLITTCIGMGSSMLFLSADVQNYNNENVCVTGVVDNVKNYSSTSIINLNNVVVNGNKVNGTTELVVYNYGNNVSIYAGDKIKADVKLTTNTKSFGNISDLTNNINYSATCSVDNIEVVLGGNLVKDAIKTKIKNNLFQFLNSDNASIAYSVLFGEKENMSASTYNVFSYAGIAHILAVSGLHIGFLVAMIVAILKLLRCNKHALNIIAFVVLVLYAYLCNFTPSVVRAVVMSMVLLLSKTYGKEYDILSSLSLAAIVVLLINPMQLFGTGFQLSFVCVLSIATLNKPIILFLSKIKCPKKLASALSVSLSVNLGVLCITAQHFKQISLISVFSNLIVLPVFSICFCCLFIISFLGLIIPLINYVLFVPNTILHFIKLIANMFANIAVLNFELFGFSYLFVALSIFACYFIGFTLVSKKFKTIASSILIFSIVGGAVLLNVPAKFNSNAGYSSKTYYGNYVFLTTKQNNRVLIINETSSERQIIEKLNNLNVNKINTLVVNNYSAKYNSQIVSLIKKYDINELIIEDSFSSVAYSEFSKLTYVNAVKNGAEVFGIEIYFKYFNEQNIGLSFVFNSNLVLMLNDGVSKTQINNLTFENIYYNYVVYNNVNNNIAMLITAQNYVNL